MAVRELGSHAARARITRLQPNGEKGFRIRFKPLAAGDRQGRLTIHSDAPDSPHVLTLVGVAFDPS